MARYFFHVRDGGELISDPEGVEVPSLDSTAGECRKIVREILNEDASRAELAIDRQFEIIDEQGRLVHIIPFLEVPLD